MRLSRSSSTIKTRLRFTLYRRSAVRVASAASGYLDVFMAIDTKMAPKNSAKWLILRCGIRTLLDPWSQMQVAVGAVTRLASNSAHTAVHVSRDRPCAQFEDTTGVRQPSFDCTVVSQPSKFSDH